MVSPLNDVKIRFFITNLLALTFSVLTIRLLDAAFKHIKAHYRSQGLSKLFPQGGVNSM